MPRRAVFIVLIALFSLGLLFGRPAFSETAEAPAPITAEEAAAFRQELASLKKEITGLREDLSWKDEDRKEGALKLVEQKVRDLFERTKETSEWNKYLFVIMLTLLGIGATIIIGIVPWLQRRQFKEDMEGQRAAFREEIHHARDIARGTREITDEARDFRDRAERSMDKAESYREKASTITEELVKQKAAIDEAIAVQIETALWEIEKKKEQAARFGQFMEQGRSAVAEGQNDTALKAYERAVEIDENSHIAWASKGVVLGKVGRHGESLEASDRAIELDPNNAFAWTNKGVALRNLGRYEDALEAGNRAIELDPNNAPFWTNKGAVLIYLDRPREALSSCEKATKLDPEHASAWFNKACAHSKLGQKPKMLDALKRAIKLNPELRENAKTDEDFEPYWEDEDFKKTVGEGQ